MELTEEQIAKHREVFDDCDVDGNEHLDASEIGKVLQLTGLNPTEKEIIAFMEALDTDADGKVTFDEYLKVMGEVPLAPNGEEEIREAFGHFDKDKKGYFTKDELKAILMEYGEGLPEDKVMELLDEADTDGNDQIDYNELAKTLTAAMS